MPVQSYVITKRTGSYSRQELRDGTPLKYCFRNPEFKDHKPSGDPCDYKLYSFRHNNIIKLDDEDFRKMQKKLGLVLYVVGKKADPDSIKIPKNFATLPLGNLIALASLVSGQPMDKMTKSKAIDILTPLVEGNEEKEDA